LGDDEPAGAFANATFSSYLIRALTPQMYLRESYVSKLPLPKAPSTKLVEFETACVRLKKSLCGLDVIERSFVPGVLYRADEALTVFALLHVTEWLCETAAAEILGLSKQDIC